MSTVAQKLYTVQEVAEILGISEVQVRGLCEIGRLFAVNISTGEKRRHFRIPEESLRRFLTRKRGY